MPTQACRHLDSRRPAHLTSAPRLIFIVGAGSLTTGEDHHVLAEDLRRSPGAGTWIATPENQLKELRFLQGVDNVNWVAVSPSQTFAPGQATGFVLGSWHVTTGTMAVAILNESNIPPTFVSASRCDE